MVSHVLFDNVAISYYNKYETYFIVAAYFQASIIGNVYGYKFWNWESGATYKTNLVAKGEGWPG